MPVTELSSAPSSNSVSRDITTGRVEVRAERGTGLYQICEHGLIVNGRNSRELTAITEGDPLSAETEMLFENRMGRGDFQVRIEARTKLRATRNAFVLTAGLDVWEGEERILAESWSRQIPRDLV